MKVTDLRINSKTGRDIQPKTGRDGAKVSNYGFIIFDSQEAVEKALKAKVRLNSSLYPVVSFVLFFSADNFVRKPPP